MEIEKTPQMYLLRIWFSLSEPAAEDAIYDSFSMRKFTDIDFMTKAVPNKRTLCKFRHFLEENRLNKLFFDAIHRVAVQNGHMMKGRTIADTTSVNASRLAVGRAERCQGVWCVLGTAKLKFSPALLSPGKAGLVTLCCHLTGDTPSVSPLGCRLPQRGAEAFAPRSAGGKGVWEILRKRSKIPLLFYGK